MASSLDTGSGEGARCGQWSPVNVDADEVVDGGAEENDHEAGDGVAHLPAQLPPAHQPRVTCYVLQAVTCHVLQAVRCHVSRVRCHEVPHLPAQPPPAHAQGVEGDDDAAAEVGAGQRHHDQVKPLQTRGG